MQEIPQIHLINLDRSVDRLQRFKERNAHIGEFVRVAATDGASLDRDALIRSGKITDDLPYGPGALGCAMSHIKLWEVAVAENRAITIFEDDIAVSHHFAERAKQILSSLPPDWDFVLWGYLLNPLFVWVDLGITKVRMQGYGLNRYETQEGISEFQAADFYPAVVRLAHCFGTQAYSVSAKGARAALDHCLPLRKRWITFPDAGVTTPDEGIDCVLCGLYGSINAYICIPQVVMSCHDADSVRRTIDKAKVEAVV